MIKLLAERSAPCIFNIRDTKGHIPLEVACRFHGPEAVQILLSQGKSAFGKGDRPVLLSTLNNSRAYKCAIPMISLLLDAGANIDAANGSGNTALLSALENIKPTGDQKDFYTDICMFLIGRGCDVNISAYGLTALHIAVEKNHEMLVRKLLISGSHIDRRVIFRKPPLYYACKYEYQRIVELLVICGSNLRAEDWETHFGMWSRGEELNEKNTQVLSYIINESKQCLTLQNLCNATIRKNIRNLEIDSTELGLHHY